MLKLVETSEETAVLRSVCESNCFGTYVSSQITAYPPRLDICRFWLQGLHAAVCSNGGSVTLCAHKDADFAEIAEFLRVVGYSSLLTDLESMKSLGYNNYKSGVIMYAEANKRSCEVLDTPQTTADYRAVFDLLETGGCFEEWFADVSHRIRTGTADIRIIRKGEKIVSTAGALHISREKRVLGAVKTLGCCRSNGYASRLVNALTVGETQLLCLPELEPFYRRLGFEVTGEWAEKRYEEGQK